jgi:hypothetical protein
LHYQYVFLIEILWFCVLYLLSKSLFPALCSHEHEQLQGHVRGHLYVWTTGISHVTHGEQPFGVLNSLNYLS